MRSGDKAMAVKKVVYERCPNCSRRTAWLSRGVVSYGRHTCYLKYYGPSPTLRYVSLECLILVQPDGRRITMVDGKIVEV